MMERVGEMHYDVTALGIIVRNTQAEKRRRKRWEKRGQLHHWTVKWLHFVDGWLRASSLDGCMLCKVL
jgi:hypothetical protein